MVSDVTAGREAAAASKAARLASNTAKSEKNIFNAVEAEEAARKVAKVEDTAMDVAKAGNAASSGNKLQKAGDVLGILSAGAMIGTAGSAMYAGGDAMLGDFEGESIENPNEPVNERANGMQNGTNSTTSARPPVATNWKTVTIMVLLGILLTMGLIWWYLSKRKGKEQSAILLTKVP